MKEKFKKTLVYWSLEEAVNLLNKIWKQNEIEELIKEGKRNIRV